MLDFQVAGCLSARQPRCYGLIGHKIKGQRDAGPLCFNMVLGILSVIA